ncbi:hypothetical protein AB1Y20_018010 [Prymnesium parvum]|uniref:Methyltransferase FkbM domain-containing protein n=1 Tax=Prymnesium parvum TaxID=97485 RepID=A0AB34JLV4_PRYPA
MGSMKLLMVMISGIAVSAEEQDCSRLKEQPGWKRFSQGNQDGILQAIFSLIGETNRWAVEFGFDYQGGSGHRGEQLIMHNSGLNTRLLREHGWNVVFFDAIVNDTNVGIHKVILTEDNIVDSFHAALVPIEVDYVSIDVDSIDLWLLRALLKEYRPRVISVEYNRNFLSWMHITHIRDWHQWTRKSVYGASAGAMNHIAKINGYKVVNIMPSGMDMFFVRQDVLQAHCILHSIAQFDELAHMAGLGRRMHPTCDKQKDLPRLIDLDLELQGKHEQARLKALGEVTLLNHLNRSNPMCNNK